METSKWKKWAVCIGVICLIGILVYLIVRWKDYQVSKKQKQVEKNSKHISREDSIFLTVVCNSQTPIDKFLKNVFMNSQCPDRIFVGIYYYENTPYKTKIQHPIEKYKNLSKRWYKNWVDQIRVYTSNEFKGYCHARSLIESHLYKGERYLMHVQSTCQWVDQWDDQILQQFHTSRKRQSSDQIILTHYCTIDSVYSNCPTFEEWDKDTGYPKFTSRVYKNKTSICYPSILWCSDMTFSYATLIQTSGNKSHLVYLDHGYEFYMTLFYSLQGYTILNCSAPVTWNPNSKIRMDDANISERYQTYSNLQSWFFDVKNLYEQEFKTFSIHLYNQTISPHAKLGLNNQTTNDEILTKFGTFSNFQQIFARLQ